MLNLSRIQLELERAKEKLRNVEETIQKVEGKTFSNGPIRYGGLKTEYHSDKTRNPAALEDGKNPRRRVIASAIDSRIQRVPADDTSFGVKRGLREKREPGVGLKRQGGDTRPQGVFARLSGTPYHQGDEEDDDDFGKKPTLPSRVFTTAAEVPSRQEVIAAQAQDERSKERNKRMFGALVGTLQKFRKEETRVREREEKRMKVEKKLEEDAKREKEKLMQEKRELFLEKKRREVEIKRIEWSLNRVKEYEAWEAAVIPLKNFIQTQAKPHIFYLPNVHNAKTEERLEHSQKLVERMIEKRKTNLKEEIENSEKKARKAAAEEVEEEEAENIPEDNEESCPAEQQLQVGFETKNKENGFLEEGKKDETESSKHPGDAKGTLNEESNWVEPDKPTEVLENEAEKYSAVNEENKDEGNIDSKISNDSSNTAVEEKMEVKTDENPVDEVGDEDKMCETRQSEEISESNEKKPEERADESSDNVEVPGRETENVSDKVEEEEEEKKSDFIKSVEPNPEQTTDRKPLLSESETKTEDSCKKILESHEEKNKTGESSSRGDKSQSRKEKKRSQSRKVETQSRKTNKRSKSPRRSRSPRNTRSKRRRSTSRQRRVSRRQSSSTSPPKKSRRSRSPLPRRGQRNFSSRKRSPLPKSRRRKSSSRSSGSVSPRKNKSRSSSTSSKSD